MSVENPETAAALSLLNAGAVRQRAHRLLAIGLDDALPHFRVHLDRMDATAELVAETTRRAYPTLAIPCYSRSRHFALNGVDRWTALADRIAWPDPAARARAEFDLAMVSVFHACAGPTWRYRDPVTGSAMGRSEGLGLASLAMFAGGAFSSDPRRPLRADAEVLANFSVADLERGMQVSADNPLVGVEGRVNLLRSLGRLVASKPAVFGLHDTPRPGGLFDRVVARERSQASSADDPVRIVEGTRSIWPSPVAAGRPRRHRARRLLEASAADDRGRDQPADAVAQAVAVAVLFADIGAVAAGRHRGDRYRRADRARRIPQRRIVRR